MSQAPAMPIWTDALIGDTTHLSAEEFGAYLLLLFATWRNNGQPFLDSDDARLARICRVTTARWRDRIRPTLAPFYDLSAGTWRQKRLEKEWNYVAELREKNSKAGKASAEAKARKNNNTDSTTVPSECQPERQHNGNPQTHTQSKKEEEPSTAEVVPLPARESAQGEGYAYRGKVIRLNQRDFDIWRKTYHGVADIAAALTPLDEGMAQETPAPKSREVFFRASAYLDKKHQAAVKAGDQAMGAGFGAPGFA